MIDTTPNTAVAACDHCYWRAVRPTRDDARHALAAHESSCHPGRYHARDALRQAETRRTKQPTP